MMDKKAYCIGVDFGTDSVRTLIVDAYTGKEVVTKVSAYVRWASGLFCNPSKKQFRQHPLDYMESFEKCLTESLNQAGEEVRQNIRAISIATTGSTPVAVNKEGLPLALTPEFENDPDAMFVLWKDHTATKEAQEINELSKKFRTDYTLYAGGIYSSEWFWAKMLHILRKNKKVSAATFTWVEHCDWMPFLLTGANDATTIKRSVCAAGHKGLWAAAHGGFPPGDFFSTLDPLLKDAVEKMDNVVYTSDQAAGTLSSYWAERLGLSENVYIGIGAIDAHMGAVGGQIEPYYLSKVIGTSTCDMLIAPEEEVKEKLVKGICGQVNGSIIPGMVGMEAGQSAFGDAYAWFKDLLLWPLENTPEGKLIPEEIKQQISENLLKRMGEKAALLPFDENSEMGIDWLNGRRTPDANPLLKGALSNLDLASDAPKIFRAIVESTCFGSKQIVERFISEGIEIKGIIGVGGIAKKSSFVMQMLADVLGMPIKVHRSEQTCALGAAMFAATVGGIYTNVPDAMKAMGMGFEKYYTPNENLIELYNLRYAKYKELGAYLTKNLAPNI